ncbi:MAG: hypothetical protein NC120_01245 [Ruminococcus sp.]|nr:hypothetical protein [Ruminococcus sp.]
MPLRGISSYKANIYGGSSSASNQLANLVKRSSVNSGMLKKAYAALEKSTGKNYLAKTDAANNSISKYYKYAQSFSEWNTDLKNGSQSVYISAAKLQNSKKMDNDSFAAAVNSFASDYNDTVKTLKSSDNYSAINSGANLINTVRSYSGALEKAGITVNDDNSLTVDEKALRENSDYAKSLFDGSYSFGGKVLKRASELQTAANLSSNGTGIYNKWGITQLFGNM